jgi:hypothetical protein
MRLFQAAILIKKCKQKSSRDGFLKAWGFKLRIFLNATILQEVI